MVLQLPQQLSLRQRLERLGRRLLVTVIGALLRARARRIDTTPNAIVLVRLDERVGNLLMTTPLLQSLRLRFPNARIDWLATAKAAALLQGHPALSTVLPFRKKAVLRREGPLGAILRLRRGRYDIAINVDNPTDPSTTQMLITRLAGARWSVGFAHPGWPNVYTTAVDAPSADVHEIDMRLHLLNAVPGAGRVRDMHLSVREDDVSPEVRALRTGLSDTAMVLLNVGARLTEKQLDAERYRRVVEVCVARGLDVLVTYGPAEQELAQAVCRAVYAVYNNERHARLAPPTRLVDLAHLMRGTARVVSCDTGPMHLAVALGRPTCGLFVSTDPRRFGYATPPHKAIDLRHGVFEEHLAELDGWLRAERVN